MYLLTKGKLINLDNGLVISKNLWYDKEAEVSKNEIISYFLQNPDKISILMKYKDESARDDVFNKLVSRIQRNEDVFEL